MAYTPYADEDAFATYLHRVLNRAGFADALGWSVDGDDYDDVINEAMRRYGVQDITTISGADALSNLNLVGRAELWRQVVEATVQERNTRLADGTSAAMQQIHEQAKAMHATTEAEATGRGYAPEWYRVGVATWNHQHSPYSPYEVED